MSVAVAHASADEIRHALPGQPAAGTPDWAADPDAPTTPNVTGALAFSPDEMRRWLEGQGGIEGERDWTGQERWVSQDELTIEAFGEKEAPICIRLLDMASEAGALRYTEAVEPMFQQLKWGNMLVGIRRKGALTAVCSWKDVAMEEFHPHAYEGVGTAHIADVTAGLVSYLNDLADELLRAAA